MRRFWFLFLMPIWSNTLSCMEALPRLDDRDEGQRRIEEVREEVAESGTWPFIDWWRGRQDPLNGYLDFASRPWVSAARGSGDCEDATVLAMFILQRYETLRASVVSTFGRHSVLLWRTVDGWRVISNMILLPWVALSPWAVADMIFGSDTISVFIF